VQLIHRKMQPWGARGALSVAERERPLAFRTAPRRRSGRPATIPRRTHQSRRRGSSPRARGSRDIGAIALWPTRGQSPAHAANLRMQDAGLDVARAARGARGVLRELAATSGHRAASGRGRHRRRDLDHARGGAVAPELGDPPCAGAHQLIGRIGELELPAGQRRTASWPRASACSRWNAASGESATSQSIASGPRGPVTEKRGMAEAYSRRETQPQRRALPNCFPTTICPGSADCLSA
jgi:hypothetical protein